MTADIDVYHCADKQESHTRVRKCLYAEIDYGRSQLILIIPGGDDEDADGDARHEDPMSKEEGINILEAIK